MNGLNDLALIAPTENQRQGFQTLLVGYSESVLASRPAHAWFMNAVKL